MERLGFLVDECRTLSKSPLASENFYHTFAALALASTLLPAPPLFSEQRVLAETPLEVSLKLQRPTSSDPTLFSVINRDEEWAPAETAIIVCDVWDYHHSPNAVARLQQFVECFLALGRGLVDWWALQAGETQ